MLFFEFKNEKETKCSFTKKRNVDIPTVIANKEISKEVCYKHGDHYSYDDHHKPWRPGLGIRWNQMSNCERFAQIAQDKWTTLSKSLRSLRGNEPPWANHSGRWRQMSNLEQFAQVAHDKWANERFAQKNFNKIVFFGTFNMFFYLKKQAICSFPLF